MTNRSFEAARRADHVLFGALALFIATVSAAAGAAAAYNPYTDQSAKAVAALPVPKPAVVVAANPATPTGPVVIDASNVRRAAIADDSAMSALLREHRCLADALYFEARGEGKQGEMAVAEVIFHRLKRGSFGNSICNVVYAGAGRKGCQFSFACNGQLRRPRAPAAWQKAQYLAAMILVGQARMTNITGGAVNFHAASVNPDWTVDMQRTTQIGNHVFYRFAPRTRPL